MSIDPRCLGPEAQLQIALQLCRPVRPEKEETMQKFYCDVCGEEMPAGYKRPEMVKVGSLEQLCGAQDVCTVCGGVAGNINIAKLLLPAWREASATVRRCLEGGGDDA